jgi:flavin reductase (DIM6/NTAB) family NADH-FMN oxidoreductase RutF
MREEDVLRALAALTTGIYVLTVSDGERRHGMSASWVTQVSGNPPLLLAAVGRSHFTHDILVRSGRFALNVVGRKGRHLEDYFYSGAARRPDNLTALACEESPAGLPYLRDALASLECRIVDRPPAGDRTLFVAAVDHVAWRGPDQPLTSLDLDYVFVGRVVPRPKG